jgi:pimeloyl-ACP methyl ester carboxylesterase
LKSLARTPVAVYGEGPVSYLGLHGWGADHRTFAPLEPFLPPGVQLICPDFPGCGGVPPPGEWTIECVIEETAQTLREQSLVEPSVIIGSCLGAVFALEMLQRKVISTQRLVIVDPLIFFPMYLRVFLLGKFGEGAYRASMETGIGRIMANLISRINRSSDVDMTASLKDIDHDSAYCYLKLMTDLPNPQRYSDLELAVDIIYGEETFRFARKSSKALKAIWEHAHEHQVPKASHLPIIEQTEFTAQLIFGDDTVGQTGTANSSSAQPDTTGASTARPVRSV